MLVSRGAYFLLLSVSKEVAGQKPQPPPQGTLLHVSLTFSNVTEKSVTSLCHFRGKMTTDGTSVSWRFWGKAVTF